LPTSAAFGRVIRFLSKAYSTNKGVLGIDVGSLATTVAASFDGELSLGVYPQFGLGSSLAELLNHVSLGEITRWLGIELSDEQVRDFLYNKSLHPDSLPYSAEDYEIELAITRQLLQHAVKIAAGSFPAKAIYPAEGLLPWVEPILATGSALTQTPSLAHGALVLLDGLQPTGVTTIMLDQNHIASAVGAAAGINPLLAVQLLDSNSFVHLGTVVSPVGGARPGAPVLRLKMVYENGREVDLEVHQGALEVLPLPARQTARLQLQPLHRYDVGMGAPGRGGGLKVTGGSLGVIIDARGRPISMPEDRPQRAELIKRWLTALGGQK
jgi:hypothetical protein